MMLILCCRNNIMCSLWVLKKLCFLGTLQYTWQHNCWCLLNIQMPAGTARLESISAFNFSVGNQALMNFILLFRWWILTTEMTISKVIIAMESSSDNILCSAMTCVLFSLWYTLMKLKFAIHWGHGLTNINLVKIWIP